MRGCVITSWCWGRSVSVNLGVKSSYHPVSERIIEATSALYYWGRRYGWIGCAIGERVRSMYAVAQKVRMCVVVPWYGARAGGEGHRVHQDYH